MNKVILIFPLIAIALLSCHTELERLEAEAGLSQKEQALFKKDRPDLFEQVMEKMRAPAVDGSNYPTHYRLSQYQQAQSNRRSRQLLDWQERGPANVSGRTRALVIDPADSTRQTWYAGAVGGGVWRTPDQGQTWQHLTAGLPHLAIGGIAISAANPDVIYAGTGEGIMSLPSIDGIGIWKSSDRGETWNALPSTLGDDRFATICRMIVDPENEDLLLVSTNASRKLGRSYVFKSEDGGSSWEVMLESQGGRLTRVVQQLFHTDDFSTIFASINAVGVLRSDDLGVTWDTIFHARQGIKRIEGAVFGNDAETLYLGIEDDAMLENGGSALYKTTDGGTQWRQVLGPEGAELLNWLGRQGWYDNSIAIHPSNPDQVFLGGQSIVLEVITNDQSVSVFSPLIADQSGTIDLAENTVFLQLPFEGFGVTEAIGGLLGGSTGLGEEDLLDVLIEFSDTQASPAHRLSSLLNGITRPSFQEVTTEGIRATDLATGQPLAIAYSDENNNGKWDLPPFPDRDLQELSRLEPLFIYTYPLQEGGNPEVASNFLEQNMYTLLLSQNAVAASDSAILSGQIRIENVQIQAEYSEQEVYTGSFRGVHADHHVILLYEENDQLHFLNANDGGVAFSPNRNQFQQTGRGLRGYNTAQFYGVDKMNGADRYIAGSQDNGTYVSPEDPDAFAAWSFAPSGDGFEVLWNYQNPDLILESLQFNGIFRSSNRGQEWSLVELPPGADDGPFVTQLAGSKTDPGLVYGHSAVGVIRSTDFGLTWSIVEMPEEWVFDGGYAPIEVSLSDPNIVWSGARMGESNRLTVSENGGTVFAPVERYNGPTGQITGIATHPFHDHTAYILFGAPSTTKVLKTTDLGQTWEDLSGFADSQTSTNGFPDVVTYSLLVMPFDTNQLWAGTELGLFISEDGGASWQMANNGLPNTAIWDMKIVNNEVVVATHGRGIWSVSLPELNNYEPVASFLAPRFVEVSQDGFAGQVAVTFELRQAYDSTQLLFTLEDSLLTTMTLGANSDPLIDQASSNINTQLPDDTITQVLVEIKSFLDGRELVGARQLVDVYRLDDDFITGLFVDSINVTTQGNFARFGFTLGQEPGFSTPALQSQHPHAQLTNLLAIFQKPVVVGRATEEISYDRILILEPGDSPDITSQDFFDFGAIEASVDRGRSWVLMSGGDATFDEDWLNIYNRQLIPQSDDLYRRDTVLLTNHFEPGDTILIRFRLFSDPFVVGWGMAVDNLIIGDLVTNASTNTLHAGIEVYPNPFEQRLNVEVEGVEGLVDFKLLNAQGVTVLARTERVNQAGSRLEIDTPSLPPGVYILKIQQGMRHRSLRVLHL